jgi:uncharacterized membrane protein YkvA (DUF1232 family)
VTGRARARAIARLLPDCAVLLSRLLRDRRVRRRDKLLLGGLAGYLALPLDLIPDFVPIVGQLDDAFIVALVLRRILRATGEDVVREQWPGPARSLDLVLGLARR